MLDKRSRKKIKKHYFQGRKPLFWIGLLFTFFSILSSHIAVMVYDAHPYAWYDSFNHIDFILIGFAFLLSLMNFYIKASLLYLEHRLQIGNYKLTIFSILLPFGFTVYSMTQLPPPYIFAFISIAIIHFFHHFKLKTASF
ncbi:hypothetical protein [Paenibacillus campi]|uniref:hypothetical protein n=1 Tax=Paenibacillus campi TaxID=3106031 RepID=UPI002AFFAE96|nr:hypothetical protein [Paenibacillus sp. SGZ-1014]